MDGTVVGQRNAQGPSVEHGAIQPCLRDTLGHMFRIFDEDVVAGGAMLENRVEFRPAFRDARIQMQAFSPDRKAQYELEPGPVHPARRAGVPCPAAASDMRGHRIDIGCHHIGLDDIAADIGGGFRVIDRIEQAKQRFRVIAFAELGHRHHRPQHAMGILAAIFADAGRIALDIARLPLGLVEGRLEQQRQLVIRQYQLARHAGHGLARARRIACPRNHRPGLGDGIDAAFIAGGRAERRAIIVIAALIPLAIPGLAFQRRFQGVHMAAPFLRPLRFAARVGNFRKARHRRAMQPGQPDAFAMAVFANPVHAVVPIARSHQRQAVAAQRQAVVEGQRAMLVKAGEMIRHMRLEQAVMLAIAQPWAFEIGQALVPELAVARRLDIVHGAISQPRPIVGDAGAHPLPGIGPPPMLDIALDKLAARRPQQMGAGEIGAHQSQRHAVLQLVAEAIGPAGLVEGRARPDAAGQRLVHQPAIQHDIHGAVGRLHLHLFEDAFPLLAHIFQQSIWIGGAHFGDKRLRLRLPGRLSQQDNDLRGGTGGQRDNGLQGGAGIEAGSDSAGQGGLAQQRGGTGQRAIAPQKLATVAGPAGLLARHVEKRDAARKGRRPGIARQQRVGWRIQRGRYISCRRAARWPQYPFGIGCHRDLARTIRQVAQGQARNLDAVLHRHELHEIDGDFMRGMLEPAVAAAMPGDIGGIVVAHRLGGGAPDFAAGLVGEIDDFARPVADGIVRPRGQLVFAAVDRPSVAAAFRRDLKAKGRIGYDIDPGGGRRISARQNDNIFPGIFGKPAMAIEKFKGRQFWRNMRHRHHCARRFLHRALAGRGEHPRHPVKLVGQAAALAHQHHPRH